MTVVVNTSINRWRHTLTDIFPFPECISVIAIDYAINLVNAGHDSKTKCTNKSFLFEMKVLISVVNKTDFIAINVNKK